MRPISWEAPAWLRYAISSEAKVSLIEENIGRSGLTNLRAAVCDALSFDPDSEEAADVVIADLPAPALA